MKTTPYYQTNQTNRPAVAMLVVSGCFHLAAIIGFWSVADGGGDITHQLLSIIFAGLLFVALSVIGFAINFCGLISLVLSRGHDRSTGALVGLHFAPVIFYMFAVNLFGLLL